MIPESLLQATSSPSSFRDGAGGGGKWAKRCRSSSAQRSAMAIPNGGRRCPTASSGARAQTARRRADHDHLRIAAVGDPPSGVGVASDFKRNVGHGPVERRRFPRSIRTGRCGQLNQAASPGLEPSVCHRAAIRAISTPERIPTNAWPSITSTPRARAGPTQESTTSRSSSGLAVGKASRGWAKSRSLCWRLAAEVRADRSCQNTYPDNLPPGS